MGDKACKCGGRKDRETESSGNNPTVLVLAVTELVFSLLAGTVLCFGFSVRIMLITH